MNPDELWTWLQEEQSQSSGWQGERGETIGHERLAHILYTGLCAMYAECMQWPADRGHPGVQSLSEPGGIHGPRRRAYAPGGGVLQETSGAGGEGKNGPGESQLSVVEELGA